MTKQLDSTYSNPYCFFWNMESMKESNREGKDRKKKCLNLIIFSFLLGLSNVIPLLCRE